ncbi:hypothetical protein FRX31_028734, partial [Thalictrum thalictroides]
MKRTLKQYSILVEGFSSSKRFDIVKKLVKDMHCDGMLPSGTMRMSFKRFQDAGCIDGIEDFVRELEPERRIRSIGSCMGDSD